MSWQLPPGQSSVHVDAAQSTMQFPASQLIAHDFALTQFSWQLPLGHVVLHVESLSHV
jgi:hypothetical protein